MDRVAIRAALRRAEQNRKGWSAGKLVLGIAATLLTPLVLGSFSMLLEGQVGLSLLADWSAAIKWMIVLMAIAYVIEWQTRGKFMMKRLREFEQNDDRWLQVMTDGDAWRYDDLEGQLFWDLMMFAPRVVFEALAEFREMRLVRNVDREEAAFIVGKLIEAGRGVDVDSLQRPGESAGALGAAIAYLQVYDLIGVGERSSHIWLLTEASEGMGVVPAGRPAQTEVRA